MLESIAGRLDLGGNDTQFVWRVKLTLGINGKWKSYHAVFVCNIV